MTGTMQRDAAAAVAPTTTLAAALRRVAAVAAPLCLALVIDSATQFLVVAQLGHMGGEALYVRSLYIPIAFFVLAVQEGFGIATQVVFARLRGQGAGREEAGARVTAALARILVLGAAVFGAMALAIALAAPALAALLEVPASTLDEFLPFARTMALAAAATVPTAIAVAALRGWGRPGWSLALSVTFGGTQVLGVGLLGGALGLGVMALPIVVVAATAITLLLAPPLLHRAGILAGLAELGRALVAGAADDAQRETRALVGRLLLVVGVPVGLSYVLLMAANLATLWILTPFGAEVQTAFGAASSTQALMIVPAIGLASATAVVMNQQLGAGEPRGLPGVFRAASLLTLAVYLVIGAAFVVGTPLLARMLAGDAGVQAELVRYLAVVGPSYAGLGLALFLLTLLEQIGAGMLAVVLSLAYYIGSLTTGGVLAHVQHSPDALYLVIAVGNLASSLLVLPIAVAVVRRRAAAEPADAAGVAVDEGAAQ